MASIFTYDPDPPGVSSPWLNSSISIVSHDLNGTTGSESIERQPTPLPLHSQSFIEVDSATTKLEAEPQEGPVEYKLHLLLLSKSVVNTTEGFDLSGSNHSKIKRLSSRSESTPGKHDQSVGTSHSKAPDTDTQTKTSPQRSRQQRLEQLTTQLLWRLQQSSPYHASTTTKWTPPSFAVEDPASHIAPQPVSLIPGLEESKGALYEIGVTDDGTLVGLSEDMMRESIDTLKIMASSLGCSVNILRMVSVGELSCELNTISLGKVQHVSKKLWVAEAFVKPDLSLCSSQGEPYEYHDHISSSSRHIAMTYPQTESTTLTSRSRSTQVRISLTGATMSGKSSLLGTLSTATLDNGRGKSRLSLLKHKHELLSGVTSSIAQELVGYREVATTSEGRTMTEVINFETGHVSSWNDVHDTTGSGRLVLLTDCAGNPRYRRTALRGLIGWAPHWTLLCIPADDVEDTTGRCGSTPSSEEVLGTAAADVDLSAAYLDLCLRLRLPLVVAITKLDLASNRGLRLTLAKVLSMLKAAHRKPQVVSESAPPTSEQDLSRIASDILADASNLRSNLARNAQETVPIVLTSALSGRGVTTLHALLHELPIPAIVDPEPTLHVYLPNHARTTVLFHVEDEFQNTTRPTKSSGNESSISIIGGHLQRGTISIGDELTLGPFPSNSLAGDTEDSDTIANVQSRTRRVTTSRSFPGALHREDRFSLSPDVEWCRVQIVSIRNLRQPVQSLWAGQVGTLGIMPLSAPISSSALAMIRRGMVLAKGAPSARRGFLAEFARTDVETLAVGTTVIVYVASVRATAKIVAARVPDDKFETARYRHNQSGSDDYEASFDFEMESDGSDESNDEFSTLLVSFRFDHSREYVEGGAQVLIMDAGAGLYGGHKRGDKGVVAGLGGFVGTVLDGE